MPMKISDYDFNGPYSIDSVEATLPANRAAVYAILHKSSDGKYYVVDVGESGEVGVRLANHDRRSCWDRICNGSPLMRLRLRSLLPNNRYKYGLILLSIYYI
jgi:hypothetical protein